MIKKKLSRVLLGIILIVVVIACDPSGKDEKLPIYGRQQLIEKELNGEVTYDTIPHRIRDFSFVNQDSALVTNETFKDKIYIADFFFTSCPTICPAMKKQMLRVYDRFAENESVAILSHTIDPKYDSVSVLKDYADRLDVSSSKWHFVTGDKDEIYDIGERSYMITAGEDEEAPGGYIHSGAFLLVDFDRRIRGVYDGTISNEVDVLMNDIDKLLKEYE